jgi:hypothetical protein
MDKTTASGRIMEIADEMNSLLEEAMGLVRQVGSPTDIARARSYWLGHIRIAIGGDHGYLGGSMCSMIDTANELLEEPEEGDESDE